MLYIHSLASTSFAAPTMPASQLRVSPTMAFSFGKKAASPKKVEVSATPALHRALKGKHLSKANTSWPTLPH